MAIEKLKNVDFDMLSAEEFRSLPLNQPLDIIESIGKYIGDLDPEKLYPSSHWANPYVEIIILIRDHSKKMNLLPSAPNPPMFSCPFDSEIEAAFNQ